MMEALGWGCRSLDAVINCREFGIRFVSFLEEEEYEGLLSQFVECLRAEGMVPRRVDFLY